MTIYMIIFIHLNNLIPILTFHYCYMSGSPHLLARSHEPPCPHPPLCHARQNRSGGLTNQNKVLGYIILYL